MPLTKGRSCEGKAVYTEKQAKVRARDLNRLWQKVHPYSCHYGDHWHVGHASRNHKEQRKLKRGK